MTLSVCNVNLRAGECREAPCGRVFQPSVLLYAAVFVCLSSEGIYLNNRTVTALHSRNIAYAMQWLATVGTICIVKYGMQVHSTRQVQGMTS